MRDKLIELLNGLIGCGYELHDRIKVVSNSEIADYLISHGVTFADVPNTNVGDKKPLTIAERADIERICQTMVWKCTEMCQPGMWERYTRHMEGGERREFAQYYKDMELLYKVLTGHEMFAPSLEEDEEIVEDCESCKISWD